MASSVAILFFFNDTATTEIYTLSLHDALPIWSEHTTEERWWKQVTRTLPKPPAVTPKCRGKRWSCTPEPTGDRKSTRLNSSHANISYAVFCLKKKYKLV